MTDDDDDFNAVIAAERALLHPGVRADAAAVSALLDDRFVEFGARGATWDRPGTITALAASPDVEGIEVDEFRCVRIGPDSILLTYRMVNGPRMALRSSVWVRADGVWRVLFHQGTPVQPD